MKKNLLRETIVLFLHESFICRFLRNNGYVLNDGSCIYCKESAKMFRLLEKVRKQININLYLCPQAGKVFMFPETWNTYL